MYQVNCHQMALNYWIINPFSFILYLFILLTLLFGCYCRHPSFYLFFGEPIKRLYSIYDFLGVIIAARFSARKRFFMASKKL